MKILENSPALKFLRITTEIVWYLVWIFFASSILYLIALSFFPHLGLQGTETHSLNLENLPKFLETLEVILIPFFFALALYVLAQMRILFRTLQKEEVFTLKNAKNIRKISYALLIIAIAQLNLWSLFIALTAFVLTEIFRYGATLEEEKKLTV